MFKRALFARGKIYLMNYRRRTPENHNSKVLLVIFTYEILFSTVVISFMDLKSFAPPPQIYGGMNSGERNKERKN